MSRLLYPAPLSDSFPPPVSIVLSDSLQRVHNFGTAEALAHRIPLIFEVPARVLIRVESSIAERRGWKRSGVLAQCLFGLPGDPKKEVERLYFDEKFIEFDGSGYPYYLEFWPYLWVTDYYIEVWAQTQQTVVVIDNGEAFTLGGEPFTIDGVALLI